jgi:hypothetical protein
VIFSKLLKFFYDTNISFHGIIVQPAPHSLRGRISFISKPMVIFSLRFDRAAKNQKLLFKIASQLKMKNRQCNQRQR